MIRRLLNAWRNRRLRRQLKAWITPTPADPLEPVTLLPRPAAPADDFSLEARAAPLIAAIERNSPPAPKQPDAEWGADDSYGGSTD